MTRSILCFGDSNTHGTEPMQHLDDKRRMAPEQRWPGHLAAALGPDWRVIEEGHPGRTTVHSDAVEGAHKNGLAALPVALESHTPIDMVIVMLGTNDLKARFSLPAGDIARSVDRLLMTILASDCGPGRKAPASMLIAPPPILETGCLAAMFAGGAEKSAQFGRLYGDIAGRHGIGFLNAGSIIRSSPMDGIHFDAAEHATLGAEIARSVLSQRAAID
jgi:lysophospholipase L1-like esterase